MVTQIASETNANVEYDLTIDNHGLVTGCTCFSRMYNPGKQCKHQKAVNADIQSEIDRAARFLAARLQVQGMEETWKCQRDMAWDNRF